MKKIGHLLTFGTLIFLLAPYYTLAQVAPPESLMEPGITTRLFSCQANDTLRRCMLRLLGDVLRVILVIALAGSAIVIALAGLQYITGIGGGEKQDARQSAKNKIIYAAVGLVVAFLAWVLTVMISRVVGGGKEL